MTMTTIIASVIALFVGIAIGWFIMRLAMKYRAQNIIKEAEAEAEVIKKDKILQAKEKFLQIKAEHEKQAAARNNKLLMAENKLKQQETDISRKLEEIQRKGKELQSQQSNIEVQKELIEKKTAELDKIKKQQIEQLEAISGMSGEQAKEKLENRLPKIKIVGTYAPPFGFEKNESELDKINQMISEAHPDLLIACFGCPKQEKWIYENIEKYNAKVSVCAGATVDFLAGNVKRAPRWMSDHGLEWFYRFT